MCADSKVNIVDVSDLMELSDDRLHKYWSCPNGCMREVRSGTLKRFYHCHGCNATLEDRENRDRLGLEIEDTIAISKGDLRLEVALGIEDPSDDPETDDQLQQPDDESAEETTRPSSALEW